MRIIASEAFIAFVRGPVVIVAVEASMLLGSMSSGQASTNGIAAAAAPMMAGAAGNAGDVYYVKVQGGDATVATIPTLVRKG